MLVQKIVVGKILILNYSKLVVNLDTTLETTQQAQNKIEEDAQNR